ncbi:MAG: hypothetical protein IT454_00445 [Planctomycetes bacterium]|nr:hypothetical protein [Planctomycetota bacterium]
MSEHAHKLKAPDPARAHGAWVYLVISILAGVLTSARFDMSTAFFAGVAFLGVFVCASSFANPAARKWGRFAVGCAIIVACVVAGIATGADPMFLAYSAIAVFPAGASAFFALRHGFQSGPALAFAVVALVVAAPASACAGGAPHHLGLILLGLLAPFFAWRTWCTRQALRSRSGWTRKELKSLGWREAALAFGWTALALTVVHVVGARH